MAENERRREGVRGSRTRTNNFLQNPRGLRRGELLAIKILTKESVEHIPDSADFSRTATKRTRKPRPDMHATFPNVY